MKAINTPTTKALRILDNIMEGDPEWFVKDYNHSASLEYTRTSGDYEIFILKLYGKSASVRKLNFVDIDDALGYLASNRYYNVTGKPEEDASEEAAEETPEAPASEFASIMGRSISEHDTWYGYHAIEKIENAERAAESIRIGSKGWATVIYVNADCFDQLVRTGHAEAEPTTIEGCTIRKSWDLK